MTAKLEWYKPGFLKDLRTRAGMTQPRLGELSGFSRDDIANFERGLTRMSSGDALNLYMALAEADTTGTALKAALTAAAFEKEGTQRRVKDTERELERLLRTFEADLAFDSLAQYIEGQLRKGGKIAWRGYGSYKVDEHHDLRKQIREHLQGIVARKQKATRHIVPLRSLDGASLEGLHGPKSILEAEIRGLQHELAELKERIREKEELKAKVQESRKRNG